MSSGMYRLTWDGTARSEWKVKTFYGKVYFSTAGLVYRELAWIKKTTANSYISINFTGCNQDTRVVIDTMSPDQNYSLFGSYNMNNETHFDLTGSGGHERFRWNNTYIDTTSGYRANRCIFDCYKGLKVTQVSTGTVLFNKYNTLTGTFTCPVIMYVGCRNRNGSVNDATTTQTVYSMQVYDNGVLVRDLIPVQETSTVKNGLFDKVNNVFYQGEGTWSAGNKQLVKLVKVRTGETVIFNP